MFRRRTVVRANRITWSMTVSQSVPVDIDLTVLESEPQSPLDPKDRGWLESSYDLRNGLEVRELSIDRLPDELLKAFAKSRRG